MRKYIDKIFFQWNTVSLIIVLLASEAIALMMDGHFYNDTLLIYILPLLLWNMRGRICGRSLTWRRLGVAVAAGATGGLFMYGLLERMSMAGQEMGHPALKMIYAGAGVASIFIYVWPFFWENIRVWAEKRPNSRKITDIAFCILIVPAMWIQKEIPIVSMAGWMSAVICFASRMGQGDEDRKTNALSAVFAGIFACCMSFGNMIHTADFLDSTGKKLILGMVISTAGWYAVWKQFIYEILFCLNGRKGNMLKERKEKSGKRFALFMVFMLAAWLPYFLGFYPGVLSSDSVSQVQQIIGQLPSSNHHPWIHTQLIGICYRIGYGLFGSANGGVAVYSMVSMLLLAAAFAGICEWQYCAGLPSPVRVLSILFLALCPFNGIYSITMWKDIPFAAFMILFMLNLLDLTEDSAGKGKAAAYAALSILVCIFRSNGIYAWLFTVPFFLWQLRAEWKKWMSLSAAALGICLLYKSLLLPSLGVVEPDAVESLSIPAQQIACVIAKGGELPDGAARELEQIVDLAKVPETYNSHTSDPVKKLVRSFGNMEYIVQHKDRLAKIYAETGIKNPYLYLEAFIEQTKGYWYHKENDWIYHTTFITENDIDIWRDGKLPDMAITGMERLLDLCLNGFHVVCSLALLTYAVLFSIMVSLLNRSPVTVYMPLLGLVLTLLMATPRYGDFRYVYPLFAALPLYLGNMIYSYKDK